MLYIREVVRLHGVPMTIVFDKDTGLVGRFWKILHHAIGTKVKFNTAFHL